MSLNGIYDELSRHAHRLESDLLYGEGQMITLAKFLWRNDMPLSEIIHKYEFDKLDWETLTTFTPVHLLIDYKEHVKKELILFACDRDHLIYDEYKDAFDSSDVQNTRLLLECERLMLER
jgi:hypothetical protein